MPAGASLANINQKRGDMNEMQALQILDSIASRTQMNREAHDAAQQATQVLARALQELAELRRRGLQGREDEAKHTIVADAASGSLPAE